MYARSYHRRVSGVGYKQDVELHVCFEALQCSTGCWLPFSRLRPHPRSFRGVLCFFADSADSVKLNDDLVLACPLVICMYPWSIPCGGGGELLANSQTHHAPFIHPEKKKKTGTWVLGLGFSSLGITQIAQTYGSCFSLEMKSRLLRGWRLFKRGWLDEKDGLHHAGTRTCILHRHARETQRDGRRQTRQRQKKETCLCKEAERKMR